MISLSRSLPPPRSHIPAERGHAVDVKMAEVDDKGKQIGPMVTQKLILQPTADGQQVAMPYKPTSVGIHRIEQQLHGDRASALQIFGVGEWNDHARLHIAAADRVAQLFHRIVVSGQLEAFTFGEGGGETAAL